MPLFPGRRTSLAAGHVFNMYLCLAGRVVSGIVVNYYDLGMFNEFGHSDIMEPFKGASDDGSFVEQRYYY